MVAGAALGWIGAGCAPLGLWKRTALTLLAGLVSLVIYLDHGTRSLLVLVMGPAVSLWWISRFQRSKFGSFALLGLIAPLAFIVLQVQMLYRLQSTRANMGDLLLDRWLTLGGAIDFFQETIIALELVPTIHDYFRESVILQFLIAPIPRFLWPEKPFSEIVWFYTMQRWNVDIEVSAGNVLPGVVGQFYMSWGMIGPIFAGALFGLILVMLERRVAQIDGDRDRFALGVGAMAGLWVFVSFRLLSPGFAYPVLVAAAIVWIGASSRRVRIRNVTLSTRRAV
jgi:oligosaccharide repeat unit polymerase